MRKLVTLLVLCLSATAVFAESAAALHWTAPAGWKAGPARPMRAATYAVAPAVGDKAGGECAVYFFGAGQGGGVADNIDRWNGQFTGPGGKRAVATVAKRTVRGVTMTTIDVSGEYSGAPGYRMLGAIVEGPGGNVFIKLTGPAKTVAANMSKYDLLLASFDKDK